MFFEIPYFSGSEITGKIAGIAINQGNGSFLTWYVWSGWVVWNNPEKVVWSAQNILFVDIDLDNYKEIIVPYETRVAVLKNDGGTWRVIKSYEVPEGINEFYSFEDVDWNWARDVFYAESWSYVGFILFDDNTKISWDMPWIFIDLDKDGDKDFVYFDFGANQWCFENNSNWKFQGADLGTCDPINIDLPLNYPYFEWWVYDFDGDGNDDFYLVEVDTTYFPYWFLKVFYWTYHNP